jgi:hypothetical protein
MERPDSSPTPDSPATPDVPLPAWKRRLFTAILLLIVFAIGEAGANVFLRITRGYDGTHLYQYDYDPYKNILPARNYVDTRGIQHNVQGFRRATYVTERKPAGTIRVFVMGGSTAYGLGGLWPHIQRDFEVIKNSETIDAYLERDLQRAFPNNKVEVINAAITSTWTHHSFIYINQTILKFHPDLVFFLDGYNDYFFYEPDHDQFSSYGYSMPAQTIMGTPTIKSLLYANGWWLFRKSALIHLVGRALLVGKQLVTPKPEQPPIQIDSALPALDRTFRRSALKMHRRSGMILHDEGVIPVFAVQPMLIFERARYASMSPIEKKLFDFNVTSMRPHAEELYVRGLPILHAAEAAMSREIGAEYMDLTGIYAGQTAQMFTDYTHLTPRANEILAGYVAERIQPLLAARIAAGCTDGMRMPPCVPPTVPMTTALAPVKK